MEFVDCINRRRSIRAFAPQQVEADKIQRILEAVNQAPSAGNLQAYEVYVVNREAEKASLAKAASGQDFVASAPLVLAFCTHPKRSQGKYGQRGEQLYAVQDATIACTYAMLAATDLGLGSVWIGAFNEDKVRQVIRAPEDQRPLALLPIGYPAEEPDPSSRRAPDDLIHWIA
jgi:nitroreductase